MKLITEHITVKMLKAVFPLHPQTYMILVVMAFRSFPSPPSKFSIPPKGIKPQIRFRATPQKNKMFVWFNNWNTPQAFTMVSRILNTIQKSRRNVDS